MNRRERRHMEKQLGLQKHKKQLTRKKRWENMRENQENGKKLMEELENHVAASIQNQEDQKMSDTIQSMAESIAKRKQIPVIDAMVEAQEIYEKRTK